MFKLCACKNSEQAPSYSVFILSASFAHGLISRATLPFDNQGQVARRRCAASGADGPLVRELNIKTTVEGVGQVTGEKLIARVC